MIKKIITGGQTGADRAALDVALKFGIPHGGWIPKGRKTEKGPLPEKYLMQEMPTESYEARTEQNVLDSDGTLIIARGKLTGGTDYTRQMTLKHKKQLLGIDLNLISHFDGASLAASWIKLHRVQVLNVAGPRASEDQQIYSDVVMILENAIQILTDEQRKSKIGTERLAKGKFSFPPRTVEEAVERLVGELTLKDKTTIANMVENELITLQYTLGAYIRNEFGILSANPSLLQSCELVTGDNDLHPDYAPHVIIRELWKNLRKSHKLRVIK